MNRVFRLSLVVLFSGTFALPSAHAITDEEIERRFQQLEAENTALKEKLKKVESVLKSQGIDPVDPLIEQRISASEATSRRTAERMDQFQRSATGSRDDLSRIKLDGFMTAGFSTNDESGGLKHRPYGFNDNLDFESDSVLGLQVTFDISDKARAVTQVVANGWNYWDPRIEWAYLAYDVSDQFTVRAGRMRLPFYYMSESLDVGYSYPWVRPPLTLYTTEISNYDGFDATYLFRTGESNHRLSAYMGTFSFEENSIDRFVDIVGDDVYGANWTTYWNDWTFRAGYSHLRTKASFTANIMDEVDPVNIPGFGLVTPVDGFVRFEGEIGESLEFYSYSTSYDDGDWMALLEMGVIEVSEGNFIGDEVQGHFTLGYHLDRWMPYGGYGREYYKEALTGPTSQFARAADRNYKLNFFGMRYEIATGISAKLEWNHFYDFKGTVGPFEDADAAFGDGSFDKVDVYTFLIDAVF